jgi:hypothetical protein
VVKAVTHGIGITSIHSNIDSFMRIYPGSEIPGVQASLINAIFFPCFNSSIILSIFIFQE